MREDEILRRLSSALSGSSCTDIEAILKRAHASAVDGATETLEELMRRSILERAVAHLSGDRPGDRPGDAARGDRSTPEWVWYVYGIQPADAAVPTGAGGVLGAPVAGVEAGGLRAIVSQVRGAELDEQALRDKLEDLAWLGANAGAHAAVLGAALAAGPVVPLSFGTVFHDREGVVEMLVRHADEVRAAVDSLAGRSEWGVKVVVDTGTCDDWIEGRAAGTARTAGTVRAPAGDPTRQGRDYLVHRRAEREGRDQRRRLLLDLAAEAHEALSGLAVDACTDPPQNPELSGHEGDMILNGAYLLDEEAVEPFQRLAGELAERHAAKGVAVHVTGPWPAHHFVSLPLTGEEGEVG